MTQMENGTEEASVMFETTESANSSSYLPSMLSIRKNNSVINSSIMFSVGVISNLLALLVLKRTDCDHKRKLFYRLVAGLTVTDLTGTVSLSPVVISVYVNNFKWTGGEAVCQYFAFMMVFAGTATMTIVCLMAIERLLCIHHPYLYFTRLRKRHATYFLIGAWMFSGIVASLPLLGFGKFIIQYPGTWCFIDHYTYEGVDRGFNYLFAILALGTISVTFTCNVIVLCTLCRTKMRGRSKGKNDNSRMFSGNSRRYAEFQMAVLLIGITVVFSSCYLPLMIRILINQTRLLPEDRKLDLLVIRLASLNQILDPWVYILLRREIVSKAVSTIKSVFGKKSPELVQEFPLMTLSSTFVSEQEKHQTCCSFCWHCMCDPPPSRERTQSFLSEQSRRSPYTNRPTVKLAVRSAENGIRLTNALSKCNNGQGMHKQDKQVSFRSRYSLDDIGTVTSQPQRYIQMSILLNSREVCKDSKACSTLLVKGIGENV